MFWLAYTACSYYYPLATILWRNKVLSTFGLEEEIKIRQAINLKSKNSNLPSFPKFVGFTIYGMDKNLLKYELSGERLEFRHKKIWFVYTPFTTEGFISNPKLKFHPEAGEVLECTSKEGSFDKDAMIFSAKNSVVCHSNRLEVPVMRIELNMKTKLVHFQTRETSIVLK